MSPQACSEPKVKRVASRISLEYSPDLPGLQFARDCVRRCQPLPSSASSARLVCEKQSGPSSFPERPLVGGRDMSNASFASRQWGLHAFAPFSTVGARLPRIEFVGQGRRDL